MSSDHYFSDSPEVPSKPHIIEVKLGDRRVELETDSGVFSRDRLDPGTAALITDAPVPEDGRVLDLGCGYGPVAIAMALANPRLQVDAVDVNRRAVEVARRNVSRLNLRRIRVFHPSDTNSDARYDAIYCNPPIRIGKDALHALLSEWLARLDVSGHAYLVVQKHLGADSLARWLEATGHTVVRLASKRGYRVLDITASPDHAARARSASAP